MIILEIRFQVGYSLVGGTHFRTGRQWIIDMIWFSNPHSSLVIFHNLVKRSQSFLSYFLFGMDKATNTMEVELFSSPKWQCCRLLFKALGFWLALTCFIHSNHYATTSLFAFPITFECLSEIHQRPEYDFFFFQIIMRFIMIRVSAFQHFQLRIKLVFGNYCQFKPFN